MSFTQDANDGLVKAMLGFVIPVGIIIAMAANCGCHSVPEPTNVEVDAPAGADEALEVAVAEWAARVPHAARLDVGDLPAVRWFEGNCLDYPEHPDSCILGLYAWASFDEPEIHLLVNHPVIMAHEVLHWALDSAVADDPTHARPEWEQLVDVEAEIRPLLTAPGG